MKNILILGASRSGKSTLARMIKNKYVSYNLLHTDSIRHPFYLFLSEKGFDMLDDYENNSFLPNFILEVYLSHIRQSRGGSFIMEGAQLSPKLINEKVDLNNTIVIYLGFGDATYKDIFNNCRKYDNVLDFSYNKSDEYLLKHCKKHKKMDELYKKECQLYNFKYYNTFIDREKSLNQIFNEICKLINI